MLPRSVYRYLHIKAIVRCPWKKRARSLSRSFLHFPSVPFSRSPDSVFLKGERDVFILIPDLKLSSLLAVHIFPCLPTVVIVYAYLASCSLFSDAHLVASGGDQGPLLCV